MKRLLQSLAPLALAGFFTVGPSSAQEAFYSEEILGLISQDADRLATRFERAYDAALADGLLNGAKDSSQWDSLRRSIGKIRGSGDGQVQTELGEALKAGAAIRSTLASQSAPPEMTRQWAAVQALLNRLAVIHRLDPI